MTGSPANLTLPTPGAGVAELRAPRVPSVTARAVADPAEARRVAEDFEALYLSQMLGPVFDQLKTDGPFGGGHGETMYRSFLVDAYARAMVKAGGVGVADMVQREILRMQENVHV